MPDPRRCPCSCAACEVLRDLMDAILAACCRIEDDVAAGPLPHPQPDGRLHSALLLLCQVAGTAAPLDAR